MVVSYTIYTKLISLLRSIMLAINPGSEQRFCGMVYNRFRVNFQL
jgi:hypothetical protein